MTNARIISGQALIVSGSAVHNDNCCCGEECIDPANEDDCKCFTLSGGVYTFHARTLTVTVTGSAQCYRIGCGSSVAGHDYSGSYIIPCDATWGDANAANENDYQEDHYTFVCNNGASDLYVLERLAITVWFVVGPETVRVAVVFLSRPVTVLAGEDPATGFATTARSATYVFELDLPIIDCGVVYHQCGEMTQLSLNYGGTPPADTGDVCDHSLDPTTYTVTAKLGP